MRSNTLSNCTSLSGLRILIIAAVLTTGACTARATPAPEQPAPQTATPNALPSSNQEPTATPSSNQEPPEGTLTPSPAAQTQRSPTRTTSRTIEPGPYQVLRDTNIAYTSERKLDVYAPAEPGPWPVIVVYPGGGGAKGDMRRLSTTLASYGAVVFVPTFRTPQTEELERGAEEAACAVRFARVYAAEYSGDPARITGAGYSFGGTIAALIGLIGDEFSGDCLVREGSGYLDAVVSIEGPYDTVKTAKGMNFYEKAPPEIWERLSPMFYPAVLPPRAGVEFHLFISDLMSEVQHADTTAFYNALVKAGYTASRTVVPGITHDRFSSPLPETVNVIIEMARRQAELLN